MNTSESFEALRRANPRGLPGFTASLEAAGRAVREQVESVDTVRTPGTAGEMRRRLVHVSAVSAAVVAVAAVTVFAVGAPGGGPGVESATAAFKKAATVTAASAEHSGTVLVRVTHNGELWAGKAVYWNGADVAIVDEAPTRPRAPWLEETSGRADRELRIVDGTLYGPDGDGGWLAMGDPASIDPDSGTTPSEHLAAVREDIGGVTLRRITGGMADLTTRRLDDGSTVYRGTVAAGLIARETGFKEGQAIRMLPFGYVAHDQAANSAAPLDVAVTVGADDIVREIAVTWGTTASAWTYTVTYSDLGATPAPAAPANARSLLKERLHGGGS
jgi:hypothetical protein